MEPTGEIARAPAGSQGADEAHTLRMATKVLLARLGEAWAARQSAPGEVNGTSDGHVLVTLSLPKHLARLHEFIDARSSKDRTPLAEELERVREELEQLRHMPPQPALTATGAQLASLEEANEDLTARVRAYRQKVTAFSAERSRLEADAEAARAEAARAWEERKSMVTALSGVVKRLSAEKEELEVALARERGALGRHHSGEDQLEYWRARCDELQAEVHRLQTARSTPPIRVVTAKPGGAHEVNGGGRGAGAPSSATYPAATVDGAPSGDGDSAAGVAVATEELAQRMLRAERRAEELTEDLARAEEDAAISLAYFKTETAQLRASLTKVQEENQRMRLQVAGAERRGCDWSGLATPAASVGLAAASGTCATTGKALTPARRPLTTPQPLRMSEPPPPAHARMAAMATGRPLSVRTWAQPGRGPRRWRGFLWPRLGYLLGAIPDLDDPASFQPPSLPPEDLSAHPQPSPAATTSGGNEVAGGDLTPHGGHSGPRASLPGSNGPPLSGVGRTIAPAPATAAPLSR